MKIAIGADHRGCEAARRAIDFLRSQHHEVTVVSDLDCDASDYPDAAWSVGRAVVSQEAERGVLMCGTGIGMSMAANKVEGARAALVHDELGAEMSRAHNDANVLCLPADLLGQRLIEKILKVWLSTPFEGGRHARRVRKIMAIEQGKDPSDVR